MRLSLEKGEKGEKVRTVMVNTEGEGLKRLADWVDASWWIVFVLLSMA